MVLVLVDTLLLCCFAAASTDCPVHCVVELALSVMQCGKGKVVKVTGIANQGRTATVLLRGSNKMVLEEAERSLHDALCVIRCLVQKRFLVTGGASPEVEVSYQLSKWSKMLQVRLAQGVQAGALACAHISMQSVLAVVHAFHFARSASTHVLYSVRLFVSECLASTVSNSILSGRACTCHRVHSMCILAEHGDLLCARSRCSTNLCKCPACALKNNTGYAAALFA